MIKNCPICGKAFDVLYPDIWRYKRNNRFICSWKCIRLFDGKEERQMKERASVKRTRMSQDDMAEAVRMWKANDPGLDQYLTDHGITNIGKWKQNAKGRYGVAASATVKVDGALRIETPEAKQIQVAEVPEKPKISKPVSYDGLDVSAVRHPELGEFYYDLKFKCIDWRTHEGDEISMSPQAWKNLYYDLPKILDVLGVGV